MPRLSGPNRDGPDRPPPVLVLDIGSNAMEVRAAVTRVSSGLRRGGLSLGVRERAELVLAEALNNVVEHAYAGQDAGRIRLQLRRDPGAIHLELRDGGRPMPGLLLPEGRLKPLGHGGDLPEGGFGWYMIRRLASEVRYRREAGENVLEITLRAGIGQDG